jgi:hypothetical protein
LVKTFLQGLDVVIFRTAQNLDLGAKAFETALDLFNLKGGTGGLYH